MRMQTVALAAVLALACLAPAHAQAPPSLSQTDVDAIVLGFQTAYAETFDRRDAKSMAALMTEDATLQNEWGDVVRGRASIEAILTGLMANLPAGVRLEDTPLASHAVAADVIVSQGISKRITANAAPTPMLFVRVLVRQGGQWRLAATQIARPSSMPRPAAPPR